VIPDHLTIGCVEERDADTIEVERRIGDPAGIPLGLHENTLRPQRDFLRLDDTKDCAVDTEGVIGRAVLGGVLLDGTSIVSTE